MFRVKRVSSRFTERRTTDRKIAIEHTSVGLAHARPNHEKSQLNTLVWGERERAPIIRNAEVREDIALVYANQMAAAECRLPSFVIIILTVSLF